MHPLTLSLSPSGGEGIEMPPSPSSIKRVGVRVAYVVTHNPGYARWREVSTKTASAASPAAAMPSVVR